MPSLEGRHISLRPLSREDRDDLLKASADGELWKLFYTAAPGPETIDRWLDRALEEQARERSLPLVATMPTGQIIGSSRFMRLNFAHRRAEIGSTFFSRSVQRSAVNTEAKLLMLTYAFETMGCLCVQFRTDWLNRTSRRAIERLGAKLDGVLRNHTIMANGRVRDTVCYSMIANEWPGVRQNLEFMLSEAY
ncbi:MAG TPA: GNAT family protein [Sphingomicrobium sp.]|nr:GNAT family protein [Sphingomicrobium sp.]